MGFLALLYPVITLLGLSIVTHEAYEFDEDLITPNTVYLCKNMEDYQLLCPHQTKIDIVSATHYLKAPSYLMNHTRECSGAVVNLDQASQMTDVSCNVHNIVTQPIKNICDKKTICRISAKQFISQSHQNCRQTLLEVKYKCLPDEKKAINESICADSYIDVKCQGGFILVKKAVSLASTHPLYASSCVSNAEKTLDNHDCRDIEPFDVTEHLAEHCNQKVSCQVPPTTNYQVPRPLNSCSKLHLFISYVCLPREFKKNRFLPSISGNGASISNDEGLIKQLPSPSLHNKGGKSDYKKIPRNHEMMDESSRPLRQPTLGKEEQQLQVSENTFLAESNRSLVLYSIIASAVGLILIVLLITTVTLLCRKGHSNNANQLKANLLRTSGYGGGSGIYTSQGLKHDASFLSGLPPTSQTISTNAFANSMTNYQQQSCNNCTSSPYCIGTSRSVSNSCLSHNDMNSLFQQMNPIVNSPSVKHSRGKSHLQQSDEYNSLIGSAINSNNNNNYLNNSSCSNILFNQTHQFDPEKSSSGMGSSLPRSSDNFTQLHHAKSAFHQFTGGEEVPKHGSGASDCSRSPAISYPPFPSFYSQMESNNQPNGNLMEKSRKVESFIKGVIGDYTGQMGNESRNSNESLPIFDPPDKFKSLGNPSISLVGGKPSPLIANTSTDEDFCSLRSQLVDANDEDELHQKTFLPPTMAPLRIDINQQSVVL